MTLTPQWLDQLRERTSLSALIQKTTRLERKGSEWRACCPFHNENTPSFYVNDAKAFYHCFGCGAHGDAIRWLTDHQGMEFIDAVKELALAAGMDMPDRDPRQSARDREMGELLEVTRRAAGWFRDNLRLAAPAQDYLTARGITPADAEHFSIGWAASGNLGLLHHMAAVPQEKMEKVGLLKKREGGEIYEFFRNRIMIPIHDARGRVIAFGGRILGKGDVKYLNSPDTPLFDKGRTLFNIHRAGPAAGKAKRLIVVEGYMDVIAMHRAGVPESVAPNGTAITEAQIQLAWRHADVPILCMDGDKAGKAAMARAAIRALPLLEPGKSLSFVSPPEGKDPDDILREQGAQAVQAMLVKPRPLVDVLWAHERDAQPCDTPEQVAGFKNRMRNHIRAIKNRDVREAYGQEVAKRFQETFDARAEGVTGPRSSPLPDRRGRSRFNKPTPASREQQEIRRSGVSADVERAVVAGLVRLPHVAGGEHISKARFQDPEAARMVEVITSFVWTVDGCTEDQLREHIASIELDGLLDHIMRSAVPFNFTRRHLGEGDQRNAAEQLIEVLRKLAV